MAFRLKHFASCEAWAWLGQVELGWMDGLSSKFSTLKKNVSGPIHKLANLMCCSSLRHSAPSPLLHLPPDESSFPTGESSHSLLQSVQPGSASASAVESESMPKLFSVKPFCISFMGGKISLCLILRSASVTRFLKGTAMVVMSEGQVKTTSPHRLILIVWGLKQWPSSN